MPTDRMNDDELRLAQAYATVPAPPTLRSRYDAALERARAGAHGAERRSLRPLAAALAFAVVAAAGGVTAARLGFARGHGAGPGPVHSATPNPTPAATPRGPVVPWAALPPTGAFPQSAGASPTPPVPVPPGTPVCRASQLEGVSLHGQGATGNLDMPVALRNRSSTACVLDGYAGVTVLDAGGRVLASATGTAHRGTFFDQMPPLQVLMLGGTPPLPPATAATLQQASHGQAWMNLTWYDCKHPQATRLWVDLPGGGGRVVVPFAIQGAYSPACDGSPALAASLDRGPLLSVGYTVPSAPDYLATVLTISAPAQVHRGTTLVYDVTLWDTDSRPYQLDPCPDFNEFLAAKQAIARHQLNCAPVGSVAPGAQVTFEIHLDIPDTVPLGPSTLTWALIDGRLAAATADAPITVVG